MLSFNQKIETKSGSTTEVPMNILEWEQRCIKREGFQEFRYWPRRNNPRKMTGIPSHQNTIALNIWMVWLIPTLLMLPLPGKLLINLLPYRDRLDGGIQPTSQLLSSHYTVVRWHLIPQWTFSVPQLLLIQSRLSFCLNKPNVNLSKWQKVFPDNKKLGLP